MNATGAESTPVEKPRRRAWPAILDPRKNVHLNVFLRLAAAWLCLLGSGVILYRLLFFPPDDRFSLAWSDNPFTPELLVTAVAFGPAAFAALAALSGPRRLLVQMLAIAMVSVGFALLAGSMLFVPGDAPRGTFVVIETAVIALVYSTALLARRDLWRRNAPDERPTFQPTESGGRTARGLSRKRAVAWTAVGGVLVVIVTGVWWLSARWQFYEAEGLNLPAMYGAEAGQEVAAGGSQIRLYADHTAQLHQVSVGDVSTTSDGRPCLASATTPDSTKAAAWEYVATDTIVVHSTKGDIVLIARWVRLANLEWDVLRTPLCESGAIQWTR
ncbi:hypothetical protein [Microbacterium gorillae]|uniref:hypothetical protein n=1 Tax=Microbacterium gorillae TaxID=1231063 RepID=UPI003D992937